MVAYDLRMGALVKAESRNDLLVLKTGFIVLDGVTYNVALPKGA